MTVSPLRLFIIIASSIFYIPSTLCFSCCNNDCFCRLREEVIRKCRGVPFIAVCLGHRVQQEKDRSKWTAILHEENWDSIDHLIGALRLSYAQLDSHLKPCFAYCSIVPQNYLFEEEWLIQHWMALGFVQPNPSTDETIEDIGGSYFRSLVGRSFFQRARVDRSGERHSYSLSEMMKDLAMHISAEDCKCCTIKGPYNIPEKVRYLTVVFNMHSSQDMFEVISGGQHLHALIVVDGSERFGLKIPTDIGKRFIRLRALDLSNFCVTELPESIGELKHLRCLQLQNTKIKRLPESTCDLYSLQTLGLTNCYDLEELPNQLKNLLKLRHIDLAMTRDPLHNVCRLGYMPKGIGLLTDLQTLSRFVIGERSSGSVYTHRGGMEELADLNSLRGKLLISNLHLVKDVQEAAKAHLSSKHFLQNLELSWNNNNVNEEKAVQTSHHLKTPTIVKGLTSKSKQFFHKLEPSSSRSSNQQSEKILLECLKAPTGIKELLLSGYPGTACPSWLGSAEYMNLVTVCLYDFPGCDVLPPLGLLPVLENLHLKGWDRLISMNCSEFCGSSSRDNELHEASFKSLKKLHLERMDRLTRWDGDERCCLPSLVELVLENCCKLEQVTHSLPSLTKITVEGSLDFCGLRNFPSLKHVNVNASGEWIWGSWPSLSSSISITLCKLPTVHVPSRLGGFHTALQCLEISNCEQLVSVPDDWPPCNLSHFSVRHCPKLRELPRGIQRLKALEDMEVIACEQLTHFPEMSGLASLIRLEIAECGSIQSLPRGLPSSLQFLSINKCPRLAQSCMNAGSEDQVKMKKIFSVWIDGHEANSNHFPNPPSSIRTF
ncbi:putative disease resistance protein [Dichanthelium oligosanthes]|uniref:Putative disease resistance protein n=1 Tax=Dichanthelium oligosanthes TaxID=888268 RepID=A0A1E5VSD8_9POAL|nr:putative disease resistance protein [Dichanthelium oligosanthes]